MMGWSRLSATGPASSVLADVLPVDEDVLEQVRARVMEAIRSIPVSGEWAVRQANRLSLWRSRAVLGLAGKCGRVQAAHVSFAAAAEIMAVAIRMHSFVGEGDGLAALARRAGIPSKGRIILAGDYYMTRAGLLALNSRNIAAISEFAKLMVALSEGYSVQLDPARAPEQRVEQANGRYRLLVEEILLCCFRAAMAELGEGADGEGCKDLTRAVAMYHLVARRRKPAVVARIEEDGPLTYDYLQDLAMRGEGAELAGFLDPARLGSLMPVSAGDLVRLRGIYRRKIERLLAEMSPQARGGEARIGGGIGGAAPTRPMIGRA